MPDENDRYYEMDALIEETLAQPPPVETPELRRQAEEILGRIAPANAEGALRRAIERSVAYPYGYGFEQLGESERKVILRGNSFRELRKRLGVRIAAQGILDRFSDALSGERFAGARSFRPALSHPLARHR